MTPAPKHTIGVKSRSELAVVRVLYSKFYPQFSLGLESGDIQLRSSFQKMKFVVFGDKKYEFGQNAFYLAKSILPFNTEIISPAGVTDVDLQNTRPVNVLYYAIHCVHLTSIPTPVVTVLARVLWPQTHPSRYSMGKPVEIWCSQLLKSSNKNAFVPVENIKSHLLTLDTSLNGERVQVIFKLIWKHQSNSNSQTFQVTLCDHLQWQCTKHIVQAVH